MIQKVTQLVDDSEKLFLEEVDKMIRFIADGLLGDSIRNKRLACADCELVKVQKTKKASVYIVNIFLKNKKMEKL